MPEASAACPKCDQPRQPGALDCPFCGVIYDRYRPRVEQGLTGGAFPQRNPAAAGPQSPPPFAPSAGASPPAGAAHEGSAEVYDGPPPRAGLDEIYQGPPPAGPLPGSGTFQPTPRFTPVPAQGPVEEKGNLFTENLALSLLVALVAFLLLQAWVQSQVAGYVEGEDELSTRFLTLSGLSPPQGLGEAHMVTFVGRRFLLFGDLDQPPPGGGIPTFVVLYHQGRLASSITVEELEARVASTLDLLEIPWYVISNRPMQVLGQAERTQQIGLGTKEQPVGHLVAITYVAPDGQPALLVLAGSRDEVSRLVRELL